MVDEETAERCHPTSGRIGGVVGIGLAVIIPVAGLLDGGPGFDAWVYPACALVAFTSWTMLLRPAVSVADHHLVLRQPFSTQEVPLAAIGQVAVGRVLECRVRGKRYVSAAVGRTQREAMRDRAQDPRAIAKRSYGDFVESRITEHVERARRRVGDADPGEVTRQWAWPEIVVGAACLVGLLVTLSL